jgi:hypothetical protein
MINPAVSVGTIKSPTVRVSGVSSGNIVRLYSDSLCTRQVAEGTAISASIDLTVSSALVDGSYSFFAATHSSTANGSCSTVSASYLLDTVAPVITGTLNDGTTSSSTTSSPTLSWSAATDTAGSGVSYYEVAIGSSSGGTNIKTWTRVADGLSVTVSALSLTLGTTYYASMRAVDRAGNTSIALASDGWLVAAASSISVATWTHQAYLKAPNAEATDSFGGAVAISGDTIAIGAETESSNQTTITNGTTASSNNFAGNSGAVYVFKRTGSAWAQEAYVKAPNSQFADIFGSAVALHGDTLVVGAGYEDSNQTTITNGTSASSDNSASSSGAVYVFKRTGATWAQEAYLKAPNANTGDHFGVAVGIDGDTVAVGADYEASNQTTITNGATASADNSVTNSGAVYVFKRTGATWAQEAYIKAPNGGLSDGFGATVFINLDTVVAGATGEDSNETTITNGTTASSNNSASSSGAVYVFKRTGTAWAQEAYLKASNSETFDSFGASVSIHRDTLAVGASGEDSNQTTITNGTTASSDNLASDAGAVYVFKRTGTTWAQEAYLKSPNAEAADIFGKSVSISDDTIVVGAYDEDSNQITITNDTTASSDNSTSSAGAAYVFKRTGTTWSQQAYLKAPNAEADDRFGYATALSSDTIVIGAYQEDSSQTTITNGTTASSDNSAADAGAAYVFTRSVAAIWQSQASVTPSNGAPGSSYGASSAISGDTLVVGAGGEDSNQTTITNGTTSSSDISALNSGAAYVYKRTGTTWVQEAYLKASNAEAYDGFGGVAIDRDTIVVGATGEDSNQLTITNGTSASSDNSNTNSGAAYVFKRTGTSWAQEAYLKASNNITNGYSFGTVAISGDTIVVGSYGERSNQTTITNGTSSSFDGSIGGAGAAYVYTRSGTTWAQQAYLKAPNPDWIDYYGMTVAIHGDTIAIGAILEDSNSTTITNGTTASSDNSVVESGAVYIYKRTGTNWAQQAFIKSSNSEANDNFGSSLAIHLDTLVVGATGEDSNQTTITNGTTASSDNSAAGAGAAYVFKRTGNTWAQEAYLKAPNAEANDGFGGAVTINVDTIVVGASGEDSNQTTITNGTTASSDNSASAAGAAYVFKRSGNTWTHEAYLKAPNAAAGAGFGASVGVNSDTIVSGGAGEVYIFQR